MFSLMLQKLLHKKWIVCCVLIGNILLIAVMVSQPMYRASAFQRMLEDEFTQYWEDTQKWPTGFQANEKVINKISVMKIEDTKMAVDRVIEQVGVPVKEYVIWYETNAMNGTANIIRDNQKTKSLQLSAVSDMEEHVEIVTGRLPSAQRTEDGYLEVMASEAAMVQMDLLLEDEYELSDFYDQNGNAVKIRLVGVFKAKDDSDLFWVTTDSRLKTQVFVNLDLFRELATQETDQKAKVSMNANWYVFWDYEKMQASQISTNLSTYQKAVAEGTLSDKADAVIFQNNVAEYSAKAKRVEATLLLLQIPVLFLLCAFLYMIAGQMLQMEQNEISLLKSRGATKGQIVRLYWMQSSFLAVISLIMGIPLGMGICRFLGSATAFLEFRGARPVGVILSGEVFLYAAAAVLIAVFMMTVPVIKYSGVSIVHLKQSRARKKKSLWKKIYLDVICLAISLYGYYSFRRNNQNVLADVLSGKALDPLLYVSFALFILGCGLLLCRLQPVIMKLIYKLFGRWMKPAAYASMLETIRTGYKQEFIILFLILTVAIGISNTTMSRTILANAKSNLYHVTGAQAVVKEMWENNLMLFLSGRAAEPVYYEPDYTKFQDISDVECCTKVFQKTMSVQDKKELSNVNVMGIETKGFAEVTQLKDELLPYDYYNYLNVLASDAEGLLVSENFMTELGYKLGDKITIKDYDQGVKNTVSGYIRGFFPYWPGYDPVEYPVDETGVPIRQDQYCIVANLSLLQSKMILQPYEVWMKLSDNGEGLAQWMEENPDVEFQYVKNVNNLYEEKRSDTLIQGTNGILSMSFIVTLVLCCVGYLIYWIMSIRSRELLFGVLRAMGMRKKEIIWMLTIEQICSGLYAILAGGIVGIVSSRMFVPIIQNAYAAADQVLPLELITRISDIVRLFAVILVVVCICLMILGRIVSRMNISNALKLGED